MIRSIASVLARPAVHVDLDDDISSFRVIDHEKYNFFGNLAMIEKNRSAANMTVLLPLVAALTAAAHHTTDIVWCVTRLDIEKLDIGGLAAGE